MCRYDLRTYNINSPNSINRNDISLNSVNIINHSLNENPYINNNESFTEPDSVEVQNDNVETIYTTSIDLNIDSINNLDEILESVMQQIGDDIVRSLDISNNNNE